MHFSFKQYSCSDLLDAFGHVYQTVDVRAAAIRLSEQWSLAALSIHLRTTSIEKATEEHRKISSQFGAISSSSFRIVQQCFPISELTAITDQLQRQKLKIDDLELDLSEKCDILSRYCSDSHSDKEYWPILQQECKANNDPNVLQILVNDRRVSRDIANAGYRDSDAAIRTFLGIQFRSSNVGGLWLRADVPVCPQPVTVHRRGNEFELTFHVATEPLIADVSCTVRRNSRRDEQLLYQRVTKLARLLEKDGKQFWTGSALVRLQDKDDEVALEFVYSKLGHIASTNIRPYQHLPVDQANPLMGALKRFCSPPELTDLLRNPQTVEIQKKQDVSNRGRLFEVSIQWLLSLLGFRAIWLHAFEKAKIVKDFDHASVDCLAYKDSEDTLLLVNCSLAAPNPVELGRQAELAALLAREFVDSGTTVEAVVFSAAPAPASRQSNQAVFPVRVFYSEEISRVLRNAESGTDFSYKQFTSPWLS